MARIRTIKPDFFLHEGIAELHPLTRLLFVGLWTLADRKGRMEDRPRRIKAAVLPYDDADIEQHLDALVVAGFIVRYEANGQNYIAIPAFEKHQHCHVKEQDSTIPEPPEKQPKRVKHRASTVQAPDDTPACTSGREQEGKGREGNIETPNGVMSGSVPDVVPLKTKKQEATEVLAFLNERAERNYQPTDANLDLILARLKEGYTATQLRQVVVRKCRDWLKDDRMSAYLRPATLFNREKFNQYVGELVVPKEAGYGNHEALP